MLIIDKLRQVLLRTGDDEWFAVDALGLGSGWSEVRLSAADARAGATRKRKLCIIDARNHRYEQLRVFRQSEPLRATVAMDTSASGSLPVSDEPSVDRLRDPFKRHLLAARPSFLTITLAGCLLGAATAHVDGVSISALSAGFAMLLALSAHAAVNVQNDYFDYLNGSDALNQSRIFPYTGGSRFIQNGVISSTATLIYARSLFAATIAGGLLLAWSVGAGLLWIGVAGVTAGWAYSAEPLRLNSRGLGEICVALTFMLVVVGADFVQRRAFAPTPWWAGLSYALMTTNILYINQFPDRDADLAAGKRHWVARLPVAQARWGYVVILALAAIALLVPVATATLPAAAALGLLGLLPAGWAARDLHRYAHNPAALAPALRRTILAAHLAALSMVIGLWWLS